ncbi:MAG: DUF4249 family protein [Bacteroidia bacterium]|nr:DUF4249 family protein [Bacteroidia bacterium]NNC84681.1 DUF4249 family protein [Bacteroidia bacterium]NNM15050.1 DUF4249 family protein [Bacteroidia bacterium]
MAVFIGFSSCETDFDVNQEWTEIPVIYGLLNTADSITYVRVQKAFLGDGDAFIYASQSDSIYFQDAISVKIEEWDNGIFVDSTILVKDSLVVKDTGIFSNSPHVLFKTVGTFQVQDEKQYKLEVLNSSTGKLSTSETNVVEKIIVSKPRVQATSKVELFTQDYDVTFLSGTNGKIYDLVIRFNYLEEDVNDPTQQVSKYVDWFFPSETVPNSANNESVEILIAAGSFYTFLSSVLEPDPTVNRYYCGLDFMFSAGADDLYTYIQVNEPPLGIVQERPQFSNIEGGLGIFSSRLNTSVVDKLLTSDSEGELYSGSETSNLGFIGRSNACQ